MSESLVVDASAAMKLFVKEEGTDAVHELFRRAPVEGEFVLHVPDLFFAECANVFWKLVQFHNYSDAEARANMARLLRMPLNSWPIRDLCQEALSWALESGLTVYDACYVVLAQRLGCPLVTADSKLAEAFERALLVQKGLF